MSQAATLAAVEECRKMTDYFRQNVAKMESTQKTYDDLMREYQRRKSNYDAAAALYSQRCSKCLGIGVQRYGCDPMCTNIGLNVAPGKPEAPIYPDLGTFVCSICSQSVDITGSAGRDFVLAENAINQQMSCTTNLEKQINAQAAKDAELAAIAAQNAAATQTTTPATNASQVISVTRTQGTPAIVAATSSSKKTYLIILIIIIIVVAGILVAILFVIGEDDDLPVETILE